MCKHTEKAKEYAQQHLMSPYWFSQNFKKITGCSPAQYLISLRMAHAMNLLDNTDDTVVQIALAMGYDNTQYFHRLFRDHTGMTPSIFYRRLAGWCGERVCKLLYADSCPYAGKFVPFSPSFSNRSSRAAAPVKAVYSASISWSLARPSSVIS